MLRHTARPRHLTTTGESSPLDTEWTFSFADLMKNGEGSPLVNDSSAKLSSTGQRTAGERRGLAVGRLMVRRMQSWPVGEFPERFLTVQDGVGARPG